MGERDDRIFGLYRPHPPFNSTKPSTDRCRMGVQDNFIFYQCNRKPKMKIQGMGFCTQHGKKLVARGYVAEEWDE